MKVKMILLSLLITCVGLYGLLNTLVNSGADAELINQANEILSNTYLSLDSPFAGWGQWVSTVPTMWLLQVIIFSVIFMFGFLLFALVCSAIEKRVTNE